MSHKTMTAGVVHIWNCWTATLQHYNLFSALNLTHSFVKRGIESKTPALAFWAYRLLSSPYQNTHSSLMTHQQRTVVAWKFPLMIAGVQFFEYQKAVAWSQLRLSTFFSQNEDFSYDRTAHYFLFNAIGWREYQSVIVAGRFSKYGAYNVRKFRILSTCLCDECTDAYICLYVTVRLSCSFMSVKC